MNVDALFRKIALAGLTLVSMCSCVTHEHSTAAPKVYKPRTAHELRVMTFNLRVRTTLDGHNIWDKRRDLVVERVRAFDPDLLATQEGLDSMEAYLRQQLDDYTFRGVGRDDGKQRGEMCGVFFKTARFQLLDGGFFWLSKTPEKPGSRGWAEVWPRVVTWVKLRPRDGGATFYWFNTHFDAFSPWARAQSSNRPHRRSRTLPRHR
jgi:endonuclease/exonuclease/phosphatase family metal-dependent hydrolase